VLILRSKFLPLMLASIALFSASGSVAEPVHVRYMEGVTLGFLVLRNQNGQPLAYGELNQVANTTDGIVTDDLHFRFKDGSSFQEVTKFTQRGEFHLVSDHILQKGPAFQHESETWIDIPDGSVRARTVENGKEKETTKHFDLPADVSNGLLFTLVKNLDPNASETTVSMVAASKSPRLLTLNITPAQGKTVRVGSIKHEARHFIVKIKINGVAGVLAPLVGKQPPDIHLWIVKSEVPTFVEFLGPLTPDSPVWHIQLTAPQYGSSISK
jgi:hypothetical protein